MIALAAIAACSGSDDDASGEASPTPSDRKQICESTADLLVGEIEGLPEEIDQAVIQTMIRIHDENRDNLVTNDCDPADIERVDAALCDHLASASTVDDLPLGTLEATASSFCATTAAPSTTAG